jgi:hypothetical protein
MSLTNPMFLRASNSTSLRKKIDGYIICFCLHKIQPLSRLLYEFDNQIDILLWTLNWDHMSIVLQDNKIFEMLPCRPYAVGWDN